MKKGSKLSVYGTQIYFLELRVLLFFCPCKAQIGIHAAGGLTRVRPYSGGGGGLMIDC